MQIKRRVQTAQIIKMTLTNALPSNVADLIVILFVSHGRVKVSDSKPIDNCRQWYKLSIAFTRKSIAFAYAAGE